ncbi:hypothetical protein JCGZ_17252 [Jatropha curcas]|uniref:LysM domain-containing protein n=2 Tax=Jatropha curcas TaxID=180498 RepID=A0A067LLK3_JATCU|nr:hypothetical protein JCGZ_17252 [Jatropha curcas]
MSKPKGQGSNNHCLVHVVKDGETVESISKQYGVSIDSIAAANKLDMNILFKGQLLNIPAFGMEDPQLTKKRESFIFYKQERSQDGFLNRKAFTMLLTSHGLSHACLLNNRTKSTGYFLFLVLVIAFCIKCIIGVFHSGDPRDTELQTSDESRKNHRDQPRSMRWKSALIDVEGPNLDSDLRPDSNNASEDQDSNFFEDMSHAYSKLEIDYQKFLSECGISNQ